LSGKKVLLAALASLITLAVVALVLPFDTPGLGREVQDRVRSATGFPLEVSRSRIRLLHGLVLEEVGLVAGSYQVHVPRMVLEHRPLALLRGRRDLTGIEFEGATIDFPGGGPYRSKRSGSPSPAWTTIPGLSPPSMASTPKVS
jgi:uncharacterized protein involved in outer membrane biogenesis